RSAGPRVTVFLVIGRARLRWRDEASSGLPSGARQTPCGYPALGPLATPTPPTFRGPRPGPAAIGSRGAACPLPRHERLPRARSLPSGPMADLKAGVLRALKDMALSLEL